MNGSIKIGTAFGIPVRIHWTFVLWPYLFLTAGLSPFAVVLLTVVVFGCVVLHELGHSLVARGFGIRVLDISLWLLGGMARMSEIPENPRIEGLVAIAGPAVNFALAGLGLLGLSLSELAGFPGATFWGSFALMNLMQGAFNLIPAFPMDGGRILRAFLARKRDWLSATELAVRVGRIVAGLLFVASASWMVFSHMSLCLLPLIPVFVWMAGGRELLAVRMRHGVSPFGGGWRAAQPAVEPGGPAPAGQAPPEPGEARRPSSWGSRVFRGGFSEEAIRWLESYRGRLRKPPGE